MTAFQTERISIVIDEARTIPPEHWQAIRLAIGCHLLQYERALFHPAERADAGADARLSLDTRAVRAELLREPRCLALWFVDRPDAWLDVRAVWPDYHQELLIYPSLVYFNRARACAADWQHAPWFCVIPGVWAEMSDGKHQYLLRYNSQLEAYRCGDWHGGS